LIKRSYLSSSIVGAPLMNENPPSDPLRLTLDYYEQNAEAFDHRTREIDLSPLYEEFLPLLPAGGFILDAGCGTGRDSAAFLKRGFRVLAMDASKAMVERAAQRIRQPVLHISFAQMQFDNEFDGIWASASLLHVPKREMPQVFQDLHDALVARGILHASFRRGEGEGFREGRFFNDYGEQELRELVQSLPIHSSSGGRWSVLKIWRTGDVGQNRAGVEWVNLLARAVKPAVETP
jgi:SAM-dependent methyltransferase